MTEVAEAVKVLQRNNSDSNHCLLHDFFRSQCFQKTTLVLRFPLDTKTLLDFLLRVAMLLPGFEEDLSSSAALDSGFLGPDRHVCSVGSGSP